MSASSPVSDPAVQPSSVPSMTRSSITAWLEFAFPRHLDALLAQLAHELKDSLSEHLTRLPSQGTLAVAR